MALDPNTQALIDELKNQTIISAATVRQGIATFAPGVGKVIEESGLLGRLAQASELTEPDTQLVALYEELFQRLGAMRRIGGDLERSTRQLASCVTDLGDVAGRIRTRAGTLGYTL